MLLSSFIFVVVVVVVIVVVGVRLPGWEDNGTLRHDLVGGLN